MTLNRGLACWILPLAFSVQIQGQTQLNATQVIDLIKSNLTCDWQLETVDNIKVGSSETTITGIATTFLANMEVIKQAHESGLNMIITHEPTFWNHFDQEDPYTDLTVYREKLTFLEEHEMVIWRFHDHWHRTNPDGIYEGVVEKLDWQDYREEKDFFRIPETTLGSLAAELQTTFGAKSIRVVGDSLAVTSGVAMSLGAANYLGHLKLLSRPDVEVLIIGESREWETVEFVRDARALGLNKNLILLGHAVSEEVGMEYCARWLQSFISDISIKHIPAGEPFWGISANK